ncbi:MAG: DUF5060 domain-containing protein [Opitutaceae bacterium]
MHSRYFFDWLSGGIRSGWGWRVACLGLSVHLSVMAAPVEFSFSVPSTDGNPFAREVWATVRHPSGRDMRAPAFFREDDRFSVRIRGDEAGSYRLCSIEEDLTDGSVVVHPLAGIEPTGGVIEVVSPEVLSQVRIAPWDPRSFSRGDGSAYVPLGGNIPWAPGGREVTEYYNERLKQFGVSGLNWARIWMVHFGGTNLDWLRDPNGSQPAPGQLDVDVAKRWDAIIASAEASHVYVQIVLQHHGQYSTETNPNWEENPWNAGLPGGFLEKPADFFRSEDARRLTRQKYRYIVARWGYSPAVMAWELFNEVHWVDALRFESDEVAVAAWHAEMADFIRSVDVYRHLVTTSMEDLWSPVFARMDFLQPHIYAVNMLENMRYVDPVYQDLSKPVFYGEFGDDHMRVSDEQKRAGLTVVPPIWAGIMGRLHLPPQPWFVELLIETGNFGQLASVARFLDETRIAEREGLEPFSPSVESPDRMPFVIAPGFVWMHRPAPTIEIPIDGSVPVEMALVPGILVGVPRPLGIGFPGEATYQIDFPQAVTVAVHLHLDERLHHYRPEGTTAEVLLNDRVVAGHTWFAKGSGSEAAQSVDLRFEVAAGPQTIRIRNAAGRDWFAFNGMDTGLEVARIAAVGKRGDDFIALWVWHRERVFALEAGDTAVGTLLLEDVPEGLWTVQWWDTEQGTPVTTDQLEHGGGTLRLPTPPVMRHAAVVLTR